MKMISGGDHSSKRSPLSNNVSFKEEKHDNLSQQKSFALFYI